MFFELIPKVCCLERYTPGYNPVARKDQEGSSNWSPWYAYHMQIRGDVPKNVDLPWGWHVLLGNGLAEIIQNRRFVCLKMGALDSQKSDEHRSKVVFSTVSFYL